MTRTWASWPKRATWEAGDSIPNIQEAHGKNQGPGAFNVTELEIASHLDPKDVTLKIPERVCIEQDT